MTAIETTLEHYAPHEIKLHPDNPRDDVGDVVDLAASIGEVGILEPIVVAPAHDGIPPKSMGKAKVLLIAGHRRLAGAQKAGLKKIPAIYRGDLTTRAQQIEAMLVENLHRVDLSPMEEANGYQLLIDITGLTQAKVAEHVGQPAKRVRERLKLTRLPDGIQTKVHEGQLTIADATSFAEIAGEPDLVKDVEKAIGSSDFKWALQRAQDKAQQRAKFRKEQPLVVKAGIHQLANEPYVWGPDSEHSFLSHRSRDFDLETPIAAAAVIAIKDTIPGLAVFINESAKRIEWYCEKVSREAGRDVDDTDLPQSPEELEARRKEDERYAAEQKAHDELQDKLWAAATVRRNHLGDILHAKGNDDLAKRVLIPWMLEEGNEAGLHWSLQGTSWETLSQMLRLETATPYPDRHGLVAKKLKKLTLPALVLIVASWWTYDNELTRTTPLFERGQHYDSEPVIDWIHVLSDDLAYPWSDFEREHLALDEAGHVPTTDDGDE